jgi:hypothetical protein
MSTLCASILDNAYQGANLGPKSNAAASRRSTAPRCGVSWREAIAGLRRRDL